MKYFFQVAPHPNPYYGQAVEQLAAVELSAMLQGLSIPCRVDRLRLGGSLFLAFETPEPLTAEMLQGLAAHSSLLLLAQEENGLLRPLDTERNGYLPRSLADIPRYKGKTGASFTRMMINCALVAAGRPGDRPALVFDPMCGRGTTLFCALELGLDAAGMDVDRDELREAMHYFEAFLERARLKHTLRQQGRTAGRTSVPEAVYQLADTKAHWQSEDRRTLTFWQGDGALAEVLMKKRPADVLVADLPYGVQHAPMDGSRTTSPAQLLKRLAPAWLKAVRPGGAAAVSFNTMTLPRDQALAALRDGGWIPLENDPFGPQPHRLEQAVIRDLILAKQPLSDDSHQAKEAST